MNQIYDDFTSHFFCVFFLVRSLVHSLAHIDCIVRCVFVWVCIMRMWFSLREIVSKHFGCYQDDVVCVKWITFSMKCCLDGFAQPNERCQIYFMQKISGERTHILRTWKKIKTLERESTNPIRIDIRQEIWIWMNSRARDGKKNPSKWCFKKFSIGCFFPSPCIPGHPMDTFIVINERATTSAQWLLFFFTIWPEN